MSFHRLWKGHRQFGERLIPQRELLRQVVRHLLPNAGHQNIAASPFLHGGQYAADLLFGLGLAVDHLRHALTDGAVVIHLGVTQVLKGGQLQVQKGILRRQRTGLHIL